MNKVVSIEVAGQVFWIDEGAFETLKRYLQTMRSQLSQHESADDIYADIELRVAELLYCDKGSTQRAISPQQLDQVIEQIGYFDAEDIQANLPRRSYLDPDNKILGGVCAGLSLRLGVPAFLLRLLFLALGALFGLGVALYLLLWISLESKHDRSQAPNTARRQSPTALGLQRLVFLPISLLGLLTELVIQHVRHRRGIYAALGKNLLGAGLLIMALIFCAGLLEFLQSRLFPWPIAWLLGAAAMYLLVLLLTLYLRHAYLRRPRFEIRPALKWAALLPALVLLVATVYINLAHAERELQVVETSYNLPEGRLNLVFGERNASSGFSEPADIQLRPLASLSGKLTLRIEYLAEGANQKQAQQHIQSIAYAFDYQQGVLHLDRYWTLLPGTLRRGQAVRLVVELPAELVVESSLPLLIQGDSQPYRYSPGSSSDQSIEYLSAAGLLLEKPAQRDSPLGHNERVVMEHSFCAQFFVGEIWRCPSNLERPASDNARLNPAWIDDSSAVESLRTVLAGEQAIGIDELRKMQTTLQQSSALNQPNNPLFRYLNQLIQTRLHASGDGHDP